MPKRGGAGQGGQTRQGLTAAQVKEKRELTSGAHTSVREERDGEGGYVL
jgi:hypothetical protein